MLDVIKEYEKRTKANEKVLLGTELPNGSLIAPSVLNNNHLLISNLKTLFSEEKAEYLPYFIKKNLQDRVVRIHKIYNNLEQAPDVGSVQEVLREMDELYACCLQYGLITFGFPGKEQSQVIQNVRNKINATEAELSRLSKEIRQAEVKVNEESRQVNENLASAGKKACDEIDKKREEFVQRVNSVSASFDTQVTEFESGIKQRIEAADNLLGEITNQQSAAKQSSEACKKSLDEMTVAQQKANETLAAITSTAAQASEQFALVTSHTKGAAAQLQNAVQHAADAKAKSEAVAEHLAVAKQRQEEIDVFYGDIETHKKEMLETKKKADADFTQLKAHCAKTVEDFKNETASIVEQNTKYQEEIKELLHKAVSAGLFGVFKQRQVLLAKGRRRWLLVVALSTVGVVAGLLAVAWWMSEKADVIFFVRLGIMVPLAFLMYFAAGQYKKERQAEEEYAFKSSISFSLEPYRDLLVRMRNEDELEADFVRRLMVDIFDNPVKRLYKGKDDDTEMEALADAVTSIAGKIPAEKRKVVLDLLQKAFVG